MNKSTSLYLDFLRAIAAFGVLLVHANQPWFSNGLYARPELGHKLVMIFFVLSGYLIAFTVEKKNKGPKIYLVDRFSRLYSVVVPALILTFIVDSVGEKVNPVFYVDKINAGNQWLRYLLNLTFLQQIWGLCTKPSTNTPFWSIGYEFWYYIFFWVLCYFKGARRNLGLILICLITGVKIILLLPVWLFGVFAYKYSIQPAISRKNGAVLFLVTAGIIFTLTYFWEFSVFADRFVFGKPPLFFSSRFIFDWVYGLIVAVNIYSFNVACFEFNVPTRIVRIIRYLSSITFSLYLFHIPILNFISSLSFYDRNSYVHTVPILICIILLVAALATIGEKQRNGYKVFLEKAMNSLTPKTPDGK